MRLRSATLIVVALWLAGCGGGGSGSSGAAGSSSSSSSHGAVSDATAQAITDADLDVFKSGNASSYIVGHPQAVRQAEQLLKPLIIANTLQVKPTDQVAGGLVTSLIDQLDNTTPGLTTGAGGNEHIDPAAIHRLFVYGLKDPAKVFEPTAAQGVSQLEQLLKGVKGGERVSPAGVQPVETASQLVSRDEQLASHLWPNLAKRLAALEASLG